MKKQIEQMLDSREVAEMTGKQHKNLLADVRGYAKELAELKIQPGDFFRESSYTDANNQERPCYDITKKGCEFIAHKLTGIKGTEFTARYINRFHDMEEKLNDGESRKEKQEKPKKKNLSSTNMLVKNVCGIFKEAGVDPLYIAAEAKRLYKEQADIDIKIPLITDKETMSKLYDCTEIAKELGIMSNTGKPHNQAVSAIIKKLHIEESEIVTTAFSRNGHDDVTIQYKPSVFDAVKEWLDENNYPTKIPYADSKGNQKTCTVVYKEVA